ncbi:hypothetical protein RGL42_002812 [Vibrio parahaemolyticus]|nr:hypothetical protein [Vibrio parahaemolyticus]EIE1273558.1 hypothetical protein [Vibrio parahaemolyticus]EJC6919642.1 hypothetical protein [Vibrio parahaemolyticus]ELA8111291.1 hypothetical protein [Vibrio parahaemolyticus]ELA8165023.1 hypothetical protein [Vibrio parahaemolyticus]
MNIPENRFFVLNNMAVVPTMIFKRGLTLEELGAYCVLSATSFNWWKDVDELSNALGVPVEKLESLRQALVEKCGLTESKDEYNEEEQAERASSIYKDIRTNSEF